MEKSGDKDSAVKTVSMVMLIMLVGKMTGLLRQILVTTYLGSSLEANAFNTASMIPNSFLDFAFASAISSSFIPVFNSYLEKKGKKEAFKLANNFITIILILSVIITAVAMLFPTEMTYLFARGLNDDVRVVTSKLLIILLPTIVISAVAFSVTGILQSLDEFNVPAAMSVVSNIIIIIYTLFFLDKFSIYGLAFVFLLGWSTQLIIQIPALIKKGYIYKPYLNLSDSGLRQIGKLAIPVMLSSWVMPINNVVNTNAVSVLFDGAGTGVTAIQNANNLYTVITGVLILSISNVIFPKLSKQTANNDDEAFGQTIKSTISVMMFLLLPMTAGLLILSKPVVYAFYAYRNVGDDLAGLISTALTFYSVGMVGFGLQNILSRGFFAEKNIKVPLLTGILAIAVNAFVSYTFVKVIGVGGPALGSSVSITITGFVMLVFMYKKNRSVMDKKTLFGILKMVFVSVTMAVLVYFVYRFTGNFIGQVSIVGRMAKLFISVVFGVVYYMTVSYFLKIDEARFVFNTIFKFIKR